MQGSVAEIIRALMETQQLSVRKVSARIAEQHGGSVHGYTQQISRILNDPNYDPSLSTVRKILSALNVSSWQMSIMPPPGSQMDTKTLSDRLDQLSADVADLKLGLAHLHQAVTTLIHQSGSVQSFGSTPNSHQTSSALSDQAEQST